MEPRPRLHATPSFSPLSSASTPSILLLCLDIGLAQDNALGLTSLASTRCLSSNEDHKAISLVTDDFHRESELGWPSNRVLVTIEALSLEPLVPNEPDALTLISGPDKACRSATTLIMGTSIVKAKFHRASRLLCDPFESLNTLEEASLEQVFPNWPVPMTFARAPRPVCEPHNLPQPSNVSWIKMLGSIVPDALTSSSASSSLAQSTWQGHSSQLVRAFSRTVLGR